MLRDERAADDDDDDDDDRVKGREWSTDGSAEVVEVEEVTADGRDPRILKGDSSAQRPDKAANSTRPPCVEARASDVQGRNRRGCPVICCSPCSRAWLLRPKRPLLRTAAYREGCSSRKRLHQVEVVFIPLASRRRPDIEWANE